MSSGQARPVPADAAGLVMRQARREDLESIIDLLDSDAISAARHARRELSMAAMIAAFDAITGDPNNELWLAVTDAGAVAGTLQLTFIPGLSRHGMLRAQVEAIRVQAGLRGQGIGRRLMQHVIERARQRGCGLLQLTTDCRRDDAQRFYLGLGFVASHAGMKLALPPVVD